MEHYDRATAREQKIWPPFLYSYPFDDAQVVDRATVYGLYSRSNLNLQGYLFEIEATELSNLLNDYNAKLDELTAQEQMAVSDIVSKRYLSNIDKLIHDGKMTTKSAEISAEDAMWTAKIAALATDRTALITMQTKVATETAKTAARISELQAYIGVEGYQLSVVDIEIAEREIQSAKVEIEILAASNAVLKIQLDTVNTALQMTDVDIQIARTKIAQATTDGNIAKLDRLKDDLAIAQSQTEILAAELPVAAARVTLAETKGAEIDAEIDYFATLETRGVTEKQNKIDTMDLKQTTRLDDLEQNLELKELAINSRLEESHLGIDLSEIDATEQIALDVQKLNTMSARQQLASNKASAAIAVAQKLAMVNITSVLTHTVKKAT